MQLPDLSIYYRFNSTKVRLKVISTSLSKISSTVFQFYKSAIKRRQNDDEKTRKTRV